ncbi:MAG TPA: dTDP-glucose 4,6-dehydratase [Candidatus Polarisedimenticolaceae bacterium]|nr:dTDP-glucose 4,6-dehydratase [Candidatus Polarisedimenticolaceae bacterium]
MSSSGTWLVTGGAGFIGSNLVRHLLAEAAERIVVLDKLTYAGLRENLADLLGNPRFTFVHGDIADAALVERLLAEHAPTAILNLAAESHVDRSIDAPGAFVQTNVVGTFVLLDASRRHLARLDAAARERFRFLHVSTDEVFGSLGAEGQFTEETAYAPNSPYAASKAAADHLVQAYHRTYGLPTLLTNCSNNYGPFQFPEKLIPLMILNALDGRPLPIYGDGGNVRDWLYVEDHCSGLLAVLRRGRPGQSYNIGARNERSNLQTIDALCAILERVRPRATGSYAALKTFVADRPGHDRRYAIDPSKLERELVWKPRHDFTHGLEATVRWYLEHRDWCAAAESHGQYARGRLGLS